LKEENQKYKEALTDSFVKQGELIQEQQKKVEEHGAEIKQQGEVIQVMKQKTDKLYLTARDEKKLPPS
jgi:6-phosphogluconolactonase (cycloisomerase 2 family)